MYRKFNRHSDALPSGFVFGSSSFTSFRNPLNPDEMEYQSLGTKIRVSQENGDVLGIEISPQFDPDDTDDVDVNTVSNVDAFDIYEMSGDFEADNPIPSDNKNSD